MKKYIQTLYQEMKAAIEEVALASGNSLEQAERCYKIAETALLQLKEYIVSYAFRDRAEEILFFKELKPLFQRELIFHLELYYTELNRPIVNVQKQQEYLIKALDGIQVFFERNQLLYTYYRTGKTEYDEAFFLREGNNHEFPLQPEYSLDIDLRFSTLNSCRLAKILAYEMLNEHIQQSLRTLENPGITDLSVRQRSLWTDSKAALIELAYAMYARGSVNNGKGDIKAVIAALESTFNIQVGNFYRTFQNMRIRKKNRTNYLDSLKESLVKKMDDTDLNFL